MEISALQKKLLSAARKRPSADDVPFAFETRMMAHLRTLPGADEWGWWGRALWRGAAACAAVALLSAVWSFYPLGASTAGGGDLEEALVASANDADVNW